MALRPPPRLLLAAAAILVIMNATRVPPVVNGVQVVGLTLALALVALAVLLPGPPARSAWLLAERVLVAGAVGIGAGTGVLALLRRGGYTGPVLAVALLYLVLIAAAAVPPSRRVGLLALGGFLMLHAVLVVTVIEQWPVRLDVVVFQQDGARALLAGEDPYAITFPDIYPPAQSAEFYAPGTSVDGRLQFGYPYPPPTLLAAVPGYLAGQVRLVQVAAVLVAAGLLWWTSRDATGRAAALAVPSAVLSDVVVAGGWVEPVIVALLAAAVAAARRGLRGTPALLGLLLVSKQYFVVVLPVLWLLRVPPNRGFGRLLAGAAATGAAVVLPFLLWNPRAFWHSVVGLQFGQPFRPDSISLLVWSVHRLGWPPASVSGWLPLLGGLLAAGLAAWRAPRGPGGFALGVAFALLSTILLAKQAFPNYYLLVLAALCAAIVGLDPRRGPGARPQPGRPDALQASGPGDSGGRIP